MGSIYQQLEEKVKAKCRAKGTSFGSIEGRAILEAVAELLEGGLQIPTPVQGELKVDVSSIDDLIAEAKEAADFIKQATEDARKSADEAIQAAEEAKAAAKAAEKATTKTTSASKKADDKKDEADKPADPPADKAESETK